MLNYERGSKETIKSNVNGGAGNTTSGSLYRQIKVAKSVIQDSVNTDMLLNICEVCTILRHNLIFGVFFLVHSKFTLYKIRAG